MHVKNINHPILSKDPSKKKDKSGVFREVEYESDEERYVLYYLFELLDAGIIVSIERAKSFNLSDKIMINYQEEKKLKTKTNILEKHFNLLREHIYTPDYKVVWSCMSLSHKFLHPIWQCTKPTSPFFSNIVEDELLSTYIEVKPQFDQNNMERLFKVSQKWMYDKYKIFINLIIPQDLFKETFTPEAYKLTPTGKNKKINFKTITLKEFLEK